MHISRFRNLWGFITGTQINFSKLKDKLNAKTTLDQKINQKIKDLFGTKGEIIEDGDYLNQNIFSIDISKRISLTDLNALTSKYEFNISQILLEVTSDGLAYFIFDFIPTNPNVEFKPYWPEIADILYPKTDWLYLSLMDILKDFFMVLKMVGVYYVWERSPIKDNIAKDPITTFRIDNPFYFHWGISKVTLSDDDIAKLDQLEQEMKNKLEKSSIVVHPYILDDDIQSVMYYNWLGSWYSCSGDDQDLLTILTRIAQLATSEWAIIGSCFEIIANEVMDPRIDLPIVPKSKQITTNVRSIREYCEKMIIKYQIPEMYMDHDDRIILESYRKVLEYEKMRKQFRSLTKYIDNVSVIYQNEREAEYASKLNNLIYIITVITFSSVIAAVFQFYDFANIFFDPIFRLILIILGTAIPSVILLIILLKYRSEIK